MYKILKYLLLILVVGSVTAAPTPPTITVPKTFTDIAGNNVTTAVWNANTAFTDGYFYYCTTTVGDFKTTTPLDVPGIASNTIDLADLPCLVQPNGDYFFAVTAYYNDPSDGKLKESGAETWIPVKIAGGTITVKGIPGAPSSHKLK